MLNRSQIVRRWKIILLILVGLLILAMIVSEPVRWFVLFIPMMLTLLIVDTFVTPVCGPHDPIMIVASPKRTMNAFLMESDCGATTNNKTLVYLAPFGKKAKPRSETFLMSAAYANVCALYWTGPNTVVLELAFAEDVVGPKTSIPLSAIFDDSEKTGAVHFSVRKVPYHERCTIGWSEVFSEQASKEFLTHPGFPTYQERAEKRK